MFQNNAKAFKLIEKLLNVFFMLHRIYIYILLKNYK